MADSHHLKLDSHPGSNSEKDPADWVSSNDAMPGTLRRILRCCQKKWTLQRRLPTI